MQDGSAPRLVLMHSCSEFNSSVWVYWIVSSSKSNFGNKWRSGNRSFSSLSLLCSGTMSPGLSVDDAHSLFQSTRSIKPTVSRKPTASQAAILWPRYGRGRSFPSSFPLCSFTLCTLCTLYHFLSLSTCTVNYMHNTAADSLSPWWWCHKHKQQRCSSEIFSTIVSYSTIHLIWNHNKPVPDLRHLVFVFLVWNAYKLYKLCSNILNLMSMEFSYFGLE